MPEGAAGFAPMQLHKSLGITVLVLTVLRIAWRIARKPPVRVEQGWQAHVATLVHLGLYAFMILAPLTGWAIVSTAPVHVPTLLFGTIPWPHLPLVDALFEPSEKAHEALGYLGVILIGLHLAGALRHHVLLRDATLARMAPRGSGGLAIALLAVATILFAAPFLAFGGYRDRGEESPPAKQPSALTDDSSPALAQAPEISPLATETPAPSPAPTQVAPPTSEADMPAPPPDWSIRHGGILKFSLANGEGRIDGRFNRWSGDIAMDPERPESARIRIVVDLGSATVGDPTQDSMLTAPEFFGPAGNATWRSSAVRKVGNRSYSATGQLSLKGRTRSVPLTFTLDGTNNTTRVNGRATIDRTAFDIGSGEAAESLAPTVDLEFSFNAERQ